MGVSLKLTLVLLSLDVYGGRSDREERQGDSCHQETSDEPPRHGFPSHRFLQSILPAHAGTAGARFLVAGFVPETVQQKAVRRRTHRTIGVEPGVRMEAARVLRDSGARSSTRAYR